MTEEKGVGQLVEIARNLTTQSQRAARIVLLGGHGAGPMEIGGVGAFRAGFVDAIHEAMAGLDVLWHPSRAEGLGTAVIDAMALGVPPIAFSVGGLPELIESGVSGLLVPAGDIVAFAREASTLIEDASRRSALARNGRERAAIFSVERMAEGTLATYQRVLLQRSGLKTPN